MTSKRLSHSAFELQHPNALVKALGKSKRKIQNYSQNVKAAIGYLQLLKFQIP